MVIGGLPTMKARAQESDRLIEWSFREFTNYRLFGAGERVPTRPMSWLGAKATRWR